MFATHFRVFPYKSKEKLGGISIFALAKMPTYLRKSDHYLSKTPYISTNLMSTNLGKSADASKNGVKKVLAFKNYF